MSLRRCVFCACRTQCLIFTKACSIGLRSGEQADRNHSRAPAARIARLPSAGLWPPGLSMITMSPFLSTGASCFSSEARKHTPLIGPSKTQGAKKLLYAGHEAKRRERSACANGHKARSRAGAQYRRVPVQARTGFFFETEAVPAQEQPHGVMRDCDAPRAASSSFRTCRVRCGVCAIRSTMNARSASRTDLRYPSIFPGPPIP